MIGPSEIGRLIGQVLRYFLNVPEDVQSVTNWGVCSMHVVPRRQKLGLRSYFVMWPEPPASPGRTRMSTEDDGGRLQRQAGWRRGAVPYEDTDSCRPIQERTTCKLCVQVHAASVGPSATAWHGRIYALQTSSSIDDRLYSLKVKIRQARDSATLQ